jgi:tRNA A-37 threonylcarbamoyl transferase component Bud32
MINRELLELYNVLVSNKTDLERYNTGGMSEVRLLSPGIIVKIDKPLFVGQILVEREFSVMSELWKSGFRAMPQALDLFYDESDKPELIIEEISHGIPLEEIAIAYDNSLISKTIISEILYKCKEVLSDLWSRGFVHGDPHLRNILLGMDSSQNWYVKIIDFGMSLWENSEEEIVHHTGIDSVEKDKEFFLECLNEYDLDKLFESV